MSGDHELLPEMRVTRGQMRWGAPRPEPTQRQKAVEAVKKALWEALREEDGPFNEHYCPACGPQPLLRAALRETISTYDETIAQIAVEALGIGVHSEDE